MHFPTTNLGLVAYEGDDVGLAGLFREQVGVVDREPTDRREDLELMVGRMDSWWWM